MRVYRGGGGYFTLHTKFGSVSFHIREIASRTDKFRVILSVSISYITIPNMSSTMYQRDPRAVSTAGLNTSYAQLTGRDCSLVDRERVVLK
jgi:hypothetical protein